MEYKHPSFIILGLILTTAWALDFWKIGIRAELGSFSSEKNNTGKISRIICFALGILGLCYLSYGIMGPRTAAAVGDNKTEVLDIFLVVDVSRSMLADDISPNRIEAAKEKLREFVKLKPKDRIGLIIFSEKVFTLLPLTIDPKLIERNIENIQVGYLGAGTNIGDAIALATARLQITETKNKIIILLTDGVSNVGNLTPVQAAEEAKKYNVKIYTIGFGTDSDAKIPSPGIFGSGYQRIPGGSVDFKSLKQVSDMTGAKSYAAQSASALQQVLLEIDQLERTETKIKGQVIYNELYYQYLMIGVILFLLCEALRYLWVKERI